jgi:predicted peroxiredoxin
MVKKLMVMVTCGPSEAERATIGFGMAFTAIQQEGVEAVIGLQSNGVWLAKQGLAQHLAAEGMPPFKQIMEGFIAQGGKVLACEPCVNSRSLSQDDLAEGVTIASAQQLVQEMLAADSTVVY